MMFKFYWPYFSILLPLPVLLIFVLPRYRDINSERSKIIFPRIYKLLESFGTHKVAGRKSFWFYLFAILLLWVALIVALMRPQVIDEKTHIRQVGHDIMLAVDISQSMLALDFSTGKNAKSRLEVVKEVLEKFIKKRVSDRCGLILFGEHAYLRVPLTHETSQLMEILKRVEAGMAGLATAIGDAIGIAVKALKNKEQNNRVLILLTDGENTAGTIQPLAASAIAKEYGIRIYTIGIGRKGPVPFPDEFGSVTTVEIGMNEELLKTIAHDTGGIYFKAEASATLELVYEKISELEKFDLDMKGYQICKELFRYPLSVGLFSLLMLIIIPLFEKLLGRQRYGF